MYKYGAKMARESIVIAGETIEPGQTKQLGLPIGRLPTSVPVEIPVTVIHGPTPGPVLWVSATLHGDELNGIAIVRDVMEHIDPTTLRGTLIAAPVVNVYGFLYESRYLPDRRDLNRSFPGSKTGSLASRVAHTFMTEIVSHCTHGIDLHTGSDGRGNLPQIRGNLRDPQTLRMAEAFCAPVMMFSRNREGTLRKAATKLGLPVLLFEAGEPMRFDEEAIDIGGQGILRVMDHLGMREYSDPWPTARSLEVNSKYWIRAKRAGLWRRFKNMGESVKKGEPIGVIEEVLAVRSTVVKASRDGVLIGMIGSPVVYQGDAIVHLATLKPPEETEAPP